MKITVTIMMLALAALAFAGEEQDRKSVDEIPWFDLESCSICKHLASEEGLMEHLHWEYFKTSMGMMSVTVVDEGYETKFKNAQANMKKAGERMKSNEEMPLCGMCRSYDQLLRTGKVEWESWETPAGHIMLMTSTDPEVTEMIHEHAQKTIEEYAKMAKQLE